MKKRIAKIKKFLLITFVVIFGLTFFLKNNYRSVDNIAPEILKDPIQGDVEYKENIEFEKEGYEYKITPLYDYEISGLVVHSRLYDTWYSLHKKDKVFTVDLCMIWGSNIESKVYQKRSLRFSQDMRFCFYRWMGNISFNNSEISNSHLLIDNEKHDEIAKGILDGDQVRIKGKLVNVSAQSVDGNDSFYQNSSTIRGDTGGGACEVILVEEVEILKKGHPVIRFFNRMSFYGIIIMIIINTIYFFINFYRDEKKHADIQGQEFL